MTLMPFFSSNVFLICTNKIIKRLQLCLFYFLGLFLTVFTYIVNCFKPVFCVPLPLLTARITFEDSK